MGHHVELRLILSLTVALLALAGSAVQGRQSEGTPRSTMTGVYTADQAARGEQIYMNICVSCHPPATYTGETFRTSWGSRPLSELFTAITEKMPKNDPGSLTADEYAEVVAYLLQMNGIPAGKADLPGDVEALKTIRVETPAKP
jgi:mono/diheme cytochrome c family protein